MYKNILMYMNVYKGISIYLMYKNILINMNVFTHSLNDFLEVSTPLLFFSFSFLCSKVRLANYH